MAAELITALRLSTVELLDKDQAGRTIATLPVFDSHRGGVLAKEGTTITAGPDGEAMMLFFETAWQRKPVKEIYEAVTKAKEILFCNIPVKTPYQGYQGDSASGFVAVLQPEHNEAFGTEGAYAVRTNSDGDITEEIEGCIAITDRAWTLVQMHLKKLPQGRMLSEPVAAKEEERYENSSTDYNASLEYVKTEGPVTYQYPRRDGTLLELYGMPKNNEREKMLSAQAEAKAAAAEERRANGRLSKVKAGRIIEPTKAVSGNTNALIGNNRGRRRWGN